MLRHVTSPDGVSIACEVSGEGPPVVLVHGAGSARWSFDFVRPELESGFTVIAIDRRGRGDSSDGQGYEVEREFDDVAAVVRDAGDGALLVGHSYGALIAAGAAQLLDGLPRLVLYEPPMGGVLADGALIDRWERLIREGDRDPMLREFFREVAGYGEDQIDELALSPVWERRKQVSPTLPRELRAELAFTLDRAALAPLATRTLMLLGSESPDWARRSTNAYSEAIPNAEVRILEGHGHGATTSGPELLAAEIARSLSGPSDELANMRRARRVIDALCGRPRFDSPTTFGNSWSRRRARRASASPSTCAMPRSIAWPTPQARGRTPARGAHGSPTARTPSPSNLRL